MLYNAVKSYFYPRSPCGERLFALLCNLLHHDFYPRSPCGERLFVVLSLRGDYVFLSTLSLRRATPLTSGTKTIFTNFYPRSPCGERRCLIMLGGFAVDFYPRSPCGERLGTLRTVSVKKTFLSTLSLRRATQAQSLKIAPLCNFYPRSPCGERQFCPTLEGHKRLISIHALLAESDTLILLMEHLMEHLFLSTLSLRRATIHQEQQGEFYSHFYPRSPCGERRHCIREDVSYSIFLSTLSLRRATVLPS